MQRLKWEKLNFRIIITVDLRGRWGIGDFVAISISSDFLAEFSSKLSVYFPITPSNISLSCILNTHTQTQEHNSISTEMFCFPLLWRWLVSHLLFYRRARSIDSYRHATTLICGMKIYDYDHVPLKLFHVYHRSYKDTIRTHRVWDIRLEMFSV